MHFVPWEYNSLDLHRNCQVKHTFQKEQNAKDVASKSRYLSPRLLSIRRVRLFNSVYDGYKRLATPWEFRYIDTFT